MATTVHVSGISHETSEKEVRDFFSFCGKISNLSITPASATTGAEQSATVTFEKETAAKTALLLDNTQLGKSHVKVTGANSIDDVASKAGATATSKTDDDQNLDQEDKPRARIVAEYLAQGYALSDNVIQQAISLDSKHGFSTRFTNALQGFDSKYKATDKAKEMDSKYQVTNRAYSAWGGLSSYFEKALGTPTGQKVRSFYVEGDRQVRDVHNEARRLADLKAGKTHEPHPIDTSGHTTCSCGGESGTCGCAPGKCECATCPKNTTPASTTQKNPPTPVTSTDKSVCKCGGAEGVCGCAPGECACKDCGKSTAAATTEAKEAAQSTGQSLPAGSV